MIRDRNWISWISWQDKRACVDPELYQLIEIGKHHSCAPHSQLNIAIGPLVQAWRIGFEDARIVSETQVKELLALTDPQQINWQQARFFWKSWNEDRPRSISKGYIADKLRTHCQARGAAYGLINLGGNIVCFGAAPNHSDGHWRIGIRDPKGGRQTSWAFCQSRTKPSSLRGSMSGSWPPLKERIIIWLILRVAFPSNVGIWASRSLQRHRYWGNLDFALVWQAHSSCFTSDLSSSQKSKESS